MRAFREYLDGSAGLSAVLRHLCALVCAYRATQAVFVEPAGLWQFAWASKKAGRADTDIEQAVKDVAHALTQADREVVRGVLESTGAEYPFPSDPEYDFEWYPEVLKTVVGTQFPLSVHVHLCPRDLPSAEYARDRREIEKIVLGFLKYFSVQVEERPLAVLAAHPGDYVRGHNPGTLGGYLEDTAACTFGVTCAHVATAGAQVTGATGTRLGRVAHASMPNPSAGGQLCNLNSPALNTMDAALYASVGSTPRSGFSGPSTNYGSGQYARMKGHKSGGPHPYYIDGIGLVQTLRHAGQDYCFTGLFRIATQPTLPLPALIGLALSPSPVQGDSGAWIVAGGGSQPDWIGMLIGVDQLDGFAVDATVVVKWASNAAGATLVVW